MSELETTGDHLYYSTLDFDVWDTIRASKKLLLPSVLPLCLCRFPPDTL
jgi:hypothetical protein